ncbi:MAG: hypothetical protein WC299_08430 [Kiritimatiellia bacterium]
MIIRLQKIFSRFILPRHAPLALCLCLACLASVPSAGRARSDFNLDMEAHFNAFMPTLAVKYTVAYRLFWMDIMHLADAVVYATDGEWFNEATGEWTRAYLLVFHLDSLEEPSERGKGRYSIHNRLATVLLKPSLDALLFVKRDYMHVDSFLGKADVNNSEYFSVEGGTHNYFKEDAVSGAKTTNMPYFARIAGQRSEALRFMKAVSSLYAGGASNVPAADKFEISIYTEEAFVPFSVEIFPGLRKIEALENDFRAIYFRAMPAPRFHGKGRILAVWIAPFRYVAGMTGNNDLVWMANNTFELGMIPIRADFGLKFGSVRCSLSGIGLEKYFETDL